MDQTLLFDDVQQKYRRHNQILFSQDSLILSKLIPTMLYQSHQTLIQWALLRVLPMIETLSKRYPEDNIPRIAFQKSQAYVNKQVKLPVAKQAILAVHHRAKEISNAHDIALYHAIGQGLSTIHVKTHALGIPFYELSAIVFAHHNDFMSRVIAMIDTYQLTLNQAIKLTS